LNILPKSIGNLKSLEYLDLYNNQLTTLPESLLNLNKLKELSIAKNPLIEKRDSTTSYVIQSLIDKGKNVILY
jgi:Leucine-rich repeat (LRR) protein